MRAPEVHREPPSVPEPSPRPVARASLKERLAALAEKHAGSSPAQVQDYMRQPDPDAPPPTDAEALANLQAAFPDAEVMAG